MYPELFSIGPITIYTYGVLLAASYLLGLQFAMVRARRWGLDANRVLDLGIYIIIAALVGAKLLLLITDFDQFRASAADLLSFARSAGVFYGGLIAAIGVAFWYIHRHRHAVLDDVRCVCAGDCARARHRPARMFRSRVLLRQTDERAVGGDLHQSGCRRQRRHAARDTAASDAALRIGRRAADSDRAARDRAPWPSISWTDVLALHDSLCDLAVHHRVLSAAIRAASSSASPHLSSSHCCWRRWRSRC